MVPSVMKTLYSRVRALAAAVVIGPITAFTFRHYSYQTEEITVTVNEPSFHKGDFGNP